MNLKSKTIAAAGVAALAVPAAALAHGGGAGKLHGHERAAQAHSEAQARHNGNGNGNGHGFRGRGVRLAGVSATGLAFGDDGTLSGPITLDPTHANRGARELLDLTRDELRGTQTVTVGTAGDAVRVTYRGLQPGSAPAADDIVRVVGKVSRQDGTLDIRKIVVIRPAAEDQTGDDDDATQPETGQPGA